MKRIFIALDFLLSHDELGITPIQRSIHAYIPSYKPLEQAHITLVFIGDIDEHYLPLVQAALAHAADRFITQKMAGKISGITGVSCEDGAHILGRNAIAFIVHEHPLLTSLINYIRHSLARYGIIGKDEHGDSMLHITIGRLPQSVSKTPELKAFFAHIQAPQAMRFKAGTSCTIASFSLYRSLGNSQYEKLASYTL